ncbi:MAG: phosphate ABC transporter permease PstA [Clostridiaceae bacterium]|nr:phosphate ABC transporter permease PstA [Clostridiaceae bacterium]
MTRIRKIKDTVMQSFTWIASGISAWVLVAILVFIFSNGWKLLDRSVLFGDYHAKNIVSGFSDEHDVNATFTPPEPLEDDEVISTRFGFAVRDEIDKEKNHVHTLTWVDDHSPLRNGKITTAGPTQGKPAPFKAGMNINKLIFIDSSGEEITVGRLKQQSPQEWIPILERDARQITEFHGKEPGGGMRGSLVATLMLIGLSLLFSVPIGIFAAIYLYAIAKQNRLTMFVRSSIELLAGVPSIIFSMMGITLIFPIIQLFGASGQSIILGSLTMAVLLLPVLIRQTEEALRSVPSSYAQASLALGATQTETLFRVVLPSARNGIFSACLLAVSRIIGESAALIFTMGTAIQDSPSVGSGATSLAVQIYVLMGGENPNFELASAISIVILILVLALNLTVKVVSALSDKKGKA